MSEEKYYFIYYKQECLNGNWLESNGVIDCIHPGTWASNWEGNGVRTIVKFYSEIAKEDYDRLKEQL